MISTISNIYLCPAADVDYTDIQAVLAYSGRWLTSWRDASVADRRGRGSSAVAAIKAQGGYWLKKAADLLMHGPLTAVAELLAPYSQIYSACNGAEPLELSKRVVTRAVTRWTGGEKTITSTDLAMLIWSVLTVDPRALEPRYADYAISIERSWVDELQRYGHFRGITPGETYQRLAHLLSRDLHAYCPPTDPQPEQKRRWVSAHLLADPSTLPAPALRHYHTFLLQAHYSGLLPTANN